MRALPLLTTYTIDEFHKLIERESSHLELKTSASSRPLQEAMVAFSNTEGGTILLGVTDLREVVGRALDQGTDDQIHQAAASAHNLGSYSVREITIEGRPVVAIRVLARADGVAQTSDGRILVRRGARNQPLIGDDVWRLLASRNLRRLERAASGVPPTRIDPAAFGNFRAAQGWPADASGLDDRLRERGLLEDDELTIAGALLLTDPAQTMRTSKFVLDVRWYVDGSPNYRRRTTISGPLPNQVEAAAALLVEELGTDLVITGVHRRELPRLPAVVVREAIANAVAHRAYDRDRTAIVIEIRPQMLVVTSPGPLPDGVTIETLRHAQAARNPDIIAALRSFSLTEDAGRGIDVMQDTMRDEMLDPPIFEEIGGSVRVTLPISGPVTPRERAWLKDLERVGTLDPVHRLLLIHAARREPVTQLERRDDELHETGHSTMPRRLTNSEARSVAGLDRDGARAALQHLRDLGFLTQHGTRGGAYYLLDRSLIRGAAHGMSNEEIEGLVLEAAMSRPVANADIRSLTGLDSSAVTSLLRRLTEQGLLTRHGEKRGTTYTRA